MQDLMFHLLTLQKKSKLILVAFVISSTDFEIMHFQSVIFILKTTFEHYVRKNVLEKYHEFPIFLNV